MEQNQNQQPPVYDQQPSEPQYATSVPMMKFWEAVKTCFRKYFDFKGRARRSEYWWFMLFTFIVIIVWSFLASFILVGIIVGSGGEMSGTAIMVTTWLIMLVPMLFVIIPQYAAQTRRLHDTGHSGWWIVASLVVGIAYYALYIKTWMPILNQIRENPDAVDTVPDPSMYHSIVETMHNSPVLGTSMLVLLLASCVLGITILVFTILDSHRGVNKYGPSPKYQ